MLRKFNETRDRSGNIVFKSDKPNEAALEIKFSVASQRNAAKIGISLENVRVEVENYIFSGNFTKSCHIEIDNNSNSIKFRPIE